MISSIRLEAFCERCQPMETGLTAARKFKSYVGLGGAEKKLRQFLTDFDFTDIDTAEKAVDWEKARVIKL